MEKVDRRVKRTHQLLQEALISLTLEKGFDSVTIKDITERADVGYTTFFRHYPDKEMLLADVLDSMRGEFRELLMPQSIVTAPEQMATLLFQFVRDHADLSRVLLDSTNTMMLLRPIQEMGMQETREIFSGDDHPEVPMEITANHLMTSLVMMIRWWLDNDQPYPPEQMGHYVTKLIIQPVINTLRPQ
jgi:AcrR family transcriptional regulator